MTAPKNAGPNTRIHGTTKRHVLNGIVTRNRTGLQARHLNNGVDHVLKDSPAVRLKLFQGLLPFPEDRLGSDIVAGLTLAALGIPEVMGYTKIIGTPVVTGLYTLLLPVIIFALCGSSRFLVVSADSATAAMVAAGLGSLSVAADPAKYLALTGLVALVAAGILLGARILRVGFLADFLSRTVLVGFLSGVGIQVAVGQLHEMMGIEKGGKGFVRSPSSGFPCGSAEEESPLGHVTATDKAICRVLRRQFRPVSSGVNRNSSAARYSPSRGPEN